MDPEAMVNQAELEEGRKALKAIKAAQIPVRIAFWAYFTEPEEWRLVIVTPLVVRGGPSNGYAAIQKAFAKAEVQIPLRLVTLAAPEEPVARLGLNCERMVGPFRGGQASLATGYASAITVDPRYIIKDDDD